ncbi:HAMP domain-containing histidine kinase [Peptoniphilus sp. GNH]|nr:HAMP domain-containing histidine kinase [Peptoniphilus sp. GNH]
MENNRKVYSIWILIFITALGAACSYFLGASGKSVFSRNKRDLYGVGKLLYSCISNSLYDNEYSNVDDKFFSYAIRSYKKDRIKSSENSEDNSKYSVRYLSNLSLGQSFNPQDLNLNGNQYFLKGFYRNGRLKFTDEAKQDSPVDSALKQIVKDVMHWELNDDDGKIESINFCFAIDRDSATYASCLKNLTVFLPTMENMIISLFVCFIISGFFAIFENYDRLRNSKFYKNFYKIPIELVIFLIFVWLMVAGLVETLFYSYTKILWILFVAYFFMSFTMNLASYYLCGFIKSLILEGKQAYPLRGSLLVKLFSFDISRTNKKYLILALCGLEFLGFLASIEVVKMEYFYFIFFIWTIFLVAVYFALVGYAKEFNELVNFSEKVGSGDYSEKIESKRFKRMANNLNSISGNLDLAVKDAIKSERLKSELITNVSHDLKTPLTSILNYSDLLIKGGLNDKDRDEYTQIVFKKSMKLKKLIDDLFEASKINTRNVDLHLEELDLVELTKQALGEWEDKFSQKGFDLITDYGLNSVILQLDGTKTFRILENIFSNIYKYGLENTRVYTGIYEKDGFAVLEVKNISKFALNVSSEELIKRFARGDCSRNTEGSGLGLSIAKSLSEIQGGEFDIYIDGDLFKSIIKFKIK